MDRLVSVVNAQNEQLDRLATAAANRPGLGQALLRGIPEAQRLALEADFTALLPGGVSTRLFALDEAELEPNGQPPVTFATLDLIALVQAGDHGPYLVTTNTVTAAARIEAASHANMDAEIAHLYQPLDHPQLVDRFLDATQPRTAIFLESDFWPNLITRAAQRQIPVVFVSSQM